MNDDFVYGFLFAVVVISGILALQYGDNFNFLDSKGFTVLPSFGTALNWKSAICLSLLFGLFFKNMEGSFERRIFDGFWILALGWAVMDLFWVLKACLCGNFLFGSELLSYIDWKGISIGLIRNSALILSSLFFIKKRLLFSVSSLVAFGAAVVYWISLILIFPFTGVFFSTFVVYAVNFLYFIIALKNWSGLSWRKFLFA